MYKYIKGFNLEEYDDDGFTIENKYVDIEKPFFEGSNWFIPDDADLGGEVRLENEEGEWIEITTDGEVRLEDEEAVWSFIGGEVRLDGEWIEITADTLKELFEKNKEE